MLIAGKSAVDGYPMLFKIRDHVPQRQLMFYRKFPESVQTLSGMIFGNLGLAHFRNSAGLAGACNTGSPLLDQSSSVAFNDDTPILRLVGEEATNCDEALAVLQELSRKGAIGVIEKFKGMIFLFADTSGKALLVEAARNDLAYRLVDEGVIIRSNHFLLPEMQQFIDKTRYDSLMIQSSLARHQRLEALLSQKKMVSSRDLRQAACDSKGKFAVCNATDTHPWKSVSIWIHHLDTPPVSLACNEVTEDPQFMRV